MKWTVVWSSAAEKRLAQCWVDSSSRDLVSQAAKTIDESLAADPLEAGESRPSGRRILIASPLVATFEVLAADNLVRVLGVWLVRKKKK